MKGRRQCKAGRLRGGAGAGQQLGTRPCGLQVQRKGGPLLRSALDPRREPLDGGVAAKFCTCRILHAQNLGERMFAFGEACRRSLTLQQGGMKGEGFQDVGDGVELADGRRRNRRDKRRRRKTLVQNSAQAEFCAQNSCWAPREGWPALAFLVGGRGRARGRRLQQQ